MKEWQWKPQEIIGQYTLYLLATLIITSAIVVVCSVKMAAHGEDNSKTLLTVRGAKFGRVWHQKALTRELQISNSGHSDILTMRQSSTPSSKFHADLHLGPSLSGGQGRFALSFVATLASGEVIKLADYSALVDYEPEIDIMPRAVDCGVLKINQSKTVALSVRSKQGELIRITKVSVNKNKGLIIAKLPSKDEQTVWQLEHIVNVNISATKNGSMSGGILLQVESKQGHKQHLRVPVKFYASHAQIISNPAIK